VTVRAVGVDGGDADGERGEGCRSVQDDHRHPDRSIHLSTGKEPRGGCGQQVLET
jgi:hypothetical protein